MKFTKKLLSIMLAIAMLFSITAGIDLSAYAATNANAKAIVDNICATNGYRPGVDNYNDCYAYASAFCNKMYGTAPGGTSGYTLTRPGSFYLVGQTTGTGVSASTLSALLSQALPGDVVQMKWYTNSNLTSSSQHTAIVYSADSTSFTILQDGASWSTIQKSTYNYSGYYTRWKGSGFGISLYRYSNYNAQFGGTSGSTNAPSNLSLKTNKKSYKLNETIYFTPSGTDVVGYTIGIDKFNESKNMYSRVYTSDIGNSFQYSFSQSGYYCAYVSAWNNYGLTNSGYVYFSIGIKPQVAELYSNKSAYKIGETIHFYPNSDCADAYTIGIDKLDSTTNKYTRVFTKDISGNFDYTISSAGEYSAYISAWNATGLTDSKTIYFSVGIVPQNPKVEISKSEYNKGDNITFTPSAKYADGYTIGIDKQNESTKSYSRVVTQDIFENYHYNNVQEGVYRAYITSWNAIGIKDSTMVYFIVGKYTISYNANGGNNAPSSQTKVYSKDITITKTLPLRTNYNFIEWNTKSDGSGISYTPGSVYKGNSNLTLYAIWEPKHIHSYVSQITKATTKKNGSVVTKCSVCGTKKSTTTIYYPKTVTLSTTSYTYNGKAKKPSVIVKDSKGKKIASSNYTVSYQSGRKNVGTYTVTIKFKGNYSGTVKKTFTIKPKATTLSSVTAKSKGFTAKWKKQATQTTGYQIQYSTDKNFKKNNKTVTISKNKTTSKSVSKLKAKKKYYVRIRTYKTVKVNGKSTKIYSAWSKSKAVTTKK